MSKKCTWKDCNNKAIHIQLDKFKKEWANLCEPHHDELKNALKNGSITTITSCWLKAQGEEWCLYENFI